MYLQRPALLVLSYAELSRGAPCFLSQFNNNEFNHLHHSDISSCIIDQTLLAGYPLAALMSKCHHVSDIRRWLIFGDEEVV